MNHNIRQQLHNYFTCVALAGIALTTAGALAEGRPALDWSLHIPDAPPQRDALEPGGVSIHTSTTASMQLLARVLDANTDPASPFPDGGQCMLVRQHQSGQPESVVVRVKPFLDMTPPTQGWIDIAFALEDDRMSIDFGAKGDPTQPPSQGYTGEIVLRAALEAGRPPVLSGIFGDQTPRVTGGSALEAGQPYTLRVVWDLDSTPRTLRFLLNGEPLTTGDDQPAAMEIPGDHEIMEHGIDYLSFNMRGGMLGNIGASE